MTEMLPESVIKWLAEMRARGYTQQDCAEKLGVTPTGVSKMKRNGSTRQTALACAALLNDLEPYA
ncbi:helix-turn-helix domain-containing protein [Roseibium sp. RKSG952]|uniref:helix-turn-helix domain-containing protein n=1 Tax=Roseibium sp. RKSG952 TaxID=2529384 RepID=UPI0012BB4BAA|nr:helix-turn-helix domain-containing protein [Roseibium sp. RKSG952]MTH95538.1 XRE family transcriptional regulator [Roseibium sp. RKSG952]